MLYLVRYVLFVLNLLLAQRRLWWILYLMLSELEKQLVVAQLIWMIAELLQYCFVSASSNIYSLSYDVSLILTIAPLTVYVSITLPAQYRQIHIDIHINEPFSTTLKITECKYGWLWIAVLIYCCVIIEKVVSTLKSCEQVLLCFLSGLLKKVIFAFFLRFL